MCGFELVVEEHQGTFVRLALLVGEADPDGCIGVL